MSENDDWNFEVDDKDRTKIKKRESLASSAQKKKTLGEKKLRLDHKKKPLRQTRSSYVKEEIEEESTAEKVKGKLLDHLQTILFVAVLGVIAYFVWPLLSK